MTDLPERVTKRKVSKSNSRPVVYIGRPDLKLIGVEIGDTVKVATYSDRIVIRPEGTQAMTDIRDRNRQNASGEQTSVYCPKCDSRVKNAPKHIPACDGDSES